MLRSIVTNALRRLDLPPFVTGAVIIRACLVAVVLLMAPVPGLADPSAPILVPSSSSRIETIDRMMAALAPESAEAAATIRTMYRDHLELLALGGFADLEGALAAGGLARLPDEPGRFNLVPRLGGLHPIGEKDLLHQDHYVTARPATIGALLEVASRVKSGPIEVTSLVRHAQYQDVLRTTNANASTSVPVHTMGLAFDIALVNTPIETVYEIRRVLRRMRDAGDILFIGERRQLVFHVVPHPKRLGHFDEVYTRALGTAPATQSAVVVAPMPKRRGKAAGAGTKPSVVAEIVAFAPGEIGRPPDASRVTEELTGPLSAHLATSGRLSVFGAFAGRSVLAFVAALAAAAYRIRRASDPPGSDPDATRH